MRERKESEIMTENWWINRERYHLNRQKNGTSHAYKEFKLCLEQYEKELTDISLKDISYCFKCHCMTHTILKDVIFACGKCKNVKLGLDKNAEAKHGK